MALLLGTLLAMEMVSEGAPPAPPAEQPFWWSCVRTCHDPSLCSSLNPQPKPRWEVVAPQGGGWPDGFGDGMNGSEWKVWLSPTISGQKVTSVPSFNSRDGGFSAGPNAGLLCEAHRRGIRVLDWDTAGSIRPSFWSYQHPERILNTTEMQIWAEMLAHFMVSSGIDGFGLDIEGPILQLMAANSSARAALTDTLTTLKARMQAVVPGSLLAVWTGGAGAPWGDYFSKAQMSTAFKTVDQFWVMLYGGCGWPYAGMANAPLPLIEQGFSTMMRLGFPLRQMVAVFPWFSCDFDCGDADNPYGGRGCARLRPREYCADGKTLCPNNITQHGLAPTARLLELAQEQGNTVRRNTTQPDPVAPHDPRPSWCGTEFPAKRFRIPA